MKKIIKILLSLCVCVLAFTACGKGSGKDFDTVKDYLESDDVQAQIKEILDATEGSEMKMEITADDTSLIYTYTFKTAVELTPELEEYFEGAYEEQKSTIDEVITEMKKLIDVDNPSVVFRYLNPDGTEISSHEYK